MSRKHNRTTYTASGVHSQTDIIPTTVAGAQCSAIITLLRRKIEGGSSTLHVETGFEEAKFIYTSGDKFYFLLSCTVKMAAFIHARKISTLFNEATGHYAIKALDFPTILNAFIAHPERKVVYESVAVKNVGELPPTVRLH